MSRYKKHGLRGLIHQQIYETFYIIPYFLAECNICENLMSGEGGIYECGTLEPGEERLASQEKTWYNEMEVWYSTLIVTCFLLTKIVELQVTSSGLLQIFLAPRPFFPLLAFLKVQRSDPHRQMTTFCKARD